MVLSEEEQNVIDLFADGSGAESPGQSSTNAFKTLIATAETVFAFPESAILLWADCTRESSEYTYPDGLVAKWKGRRRGSLDRRMHNGPPNSAFRLAGGSKPGGWELDHIYDGLSFWSARNRLHFTQSAGLVAMPRHAHRRRHSDPVLSWLVRGLAFRKFSYDPAHVFSKAPHDDYGFVAGRSCEVFWP